MTDHGARELPPEWEPLADHRDVFTEYAELRDRCPVTHSSAFGGYWLLNRYDSVLSAALDWETFENGLTFIENAGNPEHEANPARSIPISLNRPEHITYRRLLDPFFRATRVAAFEPTVRMLAKDQLNPILTAGYGDFVCDVSRPFPARVLCALLGLDDAHWQTLKSLSDDADAVRGDATLRKIENEKFLAFISQVIAERRADLRNPQEDLLSGVITATIDEAPITNEIIIRIVHQLFTAGHTTTTRALASAVGFLGGDTELQKRLREDPSLIPSAVEEFLRLRPPLHQLARTVTREIAVDGVDLHQGDNVSLNFASANRDPRQFDRPDDTVIERTPNAHLTFGAGIHKCLGAPVARLELRIILEELLGNTSEIALAEGGTRELRVNEGHFLSGYDTLFIRLHGSGR